MEQILYVHISRTSATLLKDSTTAASDVKSCPFLQTWSDSCLQQLCNEFVCIVQNFCCVMYKLKTSFLLNKPSESDIQIQSQRKLFNQRFERWMYNNFSTSNAYLYKKRSFVKIQLLNIFKNRWIVAYSAPAAIGYHPAIVLCSLENIFQWSL